MATSPQNGAPSNPKPSFPRTKETILVLVDMSDPAYIMFSTQQHLIGSKLDASIYDLPDERSRFDADTAPWLKAAGITDTSVFAQALSAAILGHGTPAGCTWDGRIAVTTRDCEAARARLQQARG